MGLEQRVHVPISDRLQILKAVVCVALEYSGGGEGETMAGPLETWLSSCSSPVECSVAATTECGRSAIDKLSSALSTTASRVAQS
jgi:hypothetical protein